MSASTPPAPPPPYEELPNQSSHRAGASPNRRSRTRTVQHKTTVLNFTYNTFLATDTTRSARLGLANLPKRTEWKPFRAPIAFLKVLIAAFSIGFFILIGLAIARQQRIRHRRDAGVGWNVLARTCVEYDFCEYSTVVSNYSIDGYWEEVCETAELNINGRRLRAPQNCQIKDKAVIGRWIVQGVERDCRPSWGPVHHERCIGSNEAVSAQLLNGNVSTKSQWDVICSTAPLPLEIPSSSKKLPCQNKGSSEFVGYWQVANETCAKQDRVKHRHEAGVVWETPNPGSCMQYAVREYSAKLEKYTVDEYWKEACETTEINIHDQVIKSPNKCELTGETVRGYWKVHGNEPDCTPYWGAIGYEHCSGTNKRHISSRLWGVKDGKLWNIMCETTPLLVQGTARVPSSCENKGIFGMWGHWDILDENCKMATA